MKVTKTLKASTFQLTVLYVAFIVVALIGAIMYSAVILYALVYFYYNILKVILKEGRKLVRTKLK
jgi:cytochrome b561